MGNLYDEFTNMYSLSKTLRFELIPQGKTRENIEKEGLVKEDFIRSDYYKKVKKIIDRNHKEFISRVLNELKLDNLKKYESLYLKNNKTEKDRKDLKAIEKLIRKQIVKAFKDDQEFSILFKDTLIKETLYDYCENEEENEMVKSFEKFTTYFKGFHENRKNMYSDEEKSTAISYRIVNENLPKFIDNARIYKNKISKKLNKKDIQTLIRELDVKVGLDRIFDIEYYDYVLSGDDIESYNYVIGGFSDAEGNEYKGLNQYINEYNQTNKEKLPLLQTLYKQILSDTQSKSFVIDQFETDDEVIDEIVNIWNSLKEKVSETKELLDDIEDYDLNKIYIKNDSSITSISKSLYGDWAVIPSAIEKEYDETKNPKKITNNYIETRRKTLNKNSKYSIGHLNSIVNRTEGIEKYFVKHTTKQDSKSEKDLFDLILNKEKQFIELVENKKIKNLKSDKKSVEIIKNFLDGIKSLQVFVKPLACVEDESDKDELFYGKFYEIWNEFNEFTHLYNKVRNYVTKKPYKTEKVKLNFDNSTLLDGWDRNKEKDNNSIILRKNGKYYLAIMNKKHNKVFESNIYINDTDECFEKMDYKLLPGPNKMLPKVFFSNSRIEEFNPSEEIIRIKERESFKKGDNFSIKDCHKLIDFYKGAINQHDEWKKFGFKFSDTEKYNDISEFFKEVTEQGYKVTWRYIPEDVINNFVAEGKIYLFQIYNKDYSKYHHKDSKKNLHTLYWESIFDESNLKSVVYKLNGEAEIFFREKSIDDPVVHEKNKEIENKNPDNKKKSSIFEYDIIKDKRYTVDKFQFHVPITMNFKAYGINNINEKVNRALKKSDNYYVIGIDRGERHLLYYSVVDKNQNIVEQGTLNTISDGKGYTTDYHKLLSKREVERDKERKSWQTIENIKELKEGYLSQVVHKIYSLMIKYDAILVLEDLNFGFKRGRFKVEKQVYQKFERALIEKLNYLVLKDRECHEKGGLLNAYQLTNKFESFKKLGKQSGFLYYIPAWNTSKIDPSTGFVNMFPLKSGESIERNRQLFAKFRDIRFNKEKDYFEFEFDYSDFTYRAEGTNSEWTVCSYGERVRTFRNKNKNGEWDNEIVKLTESLKELFERFDIDYKEANLYEEIQNQNSKDFFDSLVKYFKLIVQMRNSITGTETDYMISPVMNNEGEFFDSRVSDKDMPCDADANGAYNIARKGLMIIDKIKSTEDEKLNKPDLKLTNKEWLNFAQGER